MNCRPCLPSQFLIIILSVLFMLHDCSMLLTSNLMFLGFVHLSVELLSNEGCFNVGLPNLGTALASSLLALELPSLAATAKARGAAFSTSSVTCERLV